MAAVIKVCSVSKQFPGVKALDNVSFEVEEGTIHALLGENGAGKSTLIKIISGKYSMDSGSIEIFGQKVKLASPKEAQMAGISVVHQEINLVSTLSVAENIFLGKPFKKGLLIDWKKIYRESEEILKEIGIKIDVEKRVSMLSVSEQQIIEICKALTYDARIIIMDEPTASLTGKEINILFSIIRSLKEKGITIIYISHRLDEIFEIADQLTVLRDGKYIGTRNVAQTDKSTLISLMVGRELGEEYPKIEVPIGEPVLEVSGLSNKKGLKDISFYLKRGEILGIAGLVGSGRTELMRAILCIDGYEKGQVTVKEKLQLLKDLKMQLETNLRLLRRIENNKAWFLE